MKIYTSCYTEELFQQFITNFKAYDNFFQQPIVITSNAYICSQLEYFFAKELGTCFNWAKKNISYLFELFSSKRPILNTELREIIFCQLINNIDCFSSESKQYCKNDINQIKTWNFSEKMANVFQQYLYQDPQLIDSWQSNKKIPQEEFFQAQIFQSVLNSEQVINQDVFFVPSTQNLLNNQVFREKQTLFIFLVEKLTTLHAICLEKLAEKHEVFIYQHIFSEDYLADIQKYSKGENNSLLSLWGKMAKQQFHLFIDLEENQHELIHLDKPQEMINRSLLSYLREDIIENKETKVEGIIDTNIEINSYISKNEEIEQVFNKILYLLKNKKDIYLDDIVVVLPNIEDYRGAIESLFHKNYPKIEYQFFDLFAYQSTGLARLVDKVIEFYKNDLRKDLFFDIVSNSLVIEAKNWEQDTIKGFFETCQSYQIKNENDLGVFSWSNGFENIINDYFIESQELDLLGIKVQVELIENLDEFYELVEMFICYKSFFFQAHTIEQWSAIFRKILSKLILPINNLQESLIFEQLFDKIDSALLGNNKISLDVFYCYLENSLKGLKIYNNNTGITFAKPQAIHQVSFKYTFILGMDNKNYISSNDSLNLISKKPYFINHKDTLEHYFLKIIFLCTEELYLSYDLEDNKSANIILRNLEYFIRNTYKNSFCIQHNLSEDIEQSKDCYINDNLSRVPVINNIPKYYHLRNRLLSIQNFIELLCVPLKLLCSQNFFKANIFLSEKLFEFKLPSFLKEEKNLLQAVNYAIAENKNLSQTYIKLLDVKEKRGLLVKSLNVKQVQKYISYLNKDDYANRLNLPKIIDFEHYSIKLSPSLIIVPQKDNSYKIVLVDSTRKEDVLKETLVLCLYLITLGKREVINIDYTFIINPRTKKYFRVDLSNSYWDEIIQLDISNYSLGQASYLKKIFELSNNINDINMKNRGGNFSKEALEQLEQLDDISYSNKKAPYVYSIQKDIFNRL